MKNIAKYLLLVAICYTFTACNIERFPSTSLSAEEVANNPDAWLDMMLTGAYGQLKDWADPMHRCGEYAGDNIMIRGSSTDAFFEFISYSRTPNNYRLNTFWNNSYKAISQSSNIIKLISEGRSTDIDGKLGECYFIRGTLYFYLCRAYGRPYYDNPDRNLGVPLINGTPDDVFGPLPDRATVKETYEQVVSDLIKAAELLPVGTTNIYATREAAWAILSRVYLYMSGTYENPNTEYARLAVEYADRVINSGRFTLLSRDNFMRYNTFTPENNSETIFAVKRLSNEYSGWDHYYGVGGMYAYIGGMGWGEMYASAKYIDLLNETGRNDWNNGKIVDARAAFIEPQYVAGAGDARVLRFIRNIYNASGDHTGYTYTQLQIVSHDAAAGTARVQEATSDTNADGSRIYRYFDLTAVDAEQGYWQIEYPHTDPKPYTGVIDPEMQLNNGHPRFYIVKCSREGEESHLHSPVISRLAEVYLNKAEAAAKTGDYGTALAALNIVRERSLPGQGYASLTADNAKTLIDKERTMELAFQAERSYDVYRNGDRLTRHYPGAHNAMLEIEPTDYRVVYFIPQDAINSYPAGSTLTQNPTSN